MPSFGSFNQSFYSVLFYYYKDRFKCRCKEIYNFIDSLDEKPKPKKAKPKKKPKNNDKSNFAVFNGPSPNLTNIEAQDQFSALNDLLRSSKKIVDSKVMKTQDLS